MQYVPWHEVRERRGRLLRASCEPSSPAEGPVARMIGCVPGPPVGWRCALSGVGDESLEHMIR